VEYFRGAIALDPRYGRAHAGLSAGLVLLPYFAGVHADSVRESAVRAARAALALDTTLAEAHTSLGLVYMHANEWTESEQEHRRAIALDPSDAAAHVQYGRMLLATGRLAEATAEFERAQSLDPFSPVAASWVANTAQLGGNKEAALAFARRAVALDSTTAPALNSLARAFLAVGQGDSARWVADRLPDLAPWTGVKAYVHGRSGDVPAARAIIRDLERKRPHPWAVHFTLAWAYLGVGDTARALTALERSTDAHEIWPNWFTLFEPVYDPVRQSARLGVLAQRVGLDIARFQRPTR
jgi:serine/threonine-protein kinase